MIRLDKVDHRFHALLLAATAEVDPARVGLDRHLNAAIAAGARRINYAIVQEEAERLLPIFRLLVKKMLKNDLTPIPR